METSGKTFGGAAKIATPAIIQGFRVADQLDLAKYSRPDQTRTPV